MKWEKGRGGRKDVNNCNRMDGIFGRKTKDEAEKNQRRESANLENSRWFIIDVIRGGGGGGCGFTY